MTRSSNPLAQSKEVASADGRRERSRSSRAKIVSALLELVGKGDVSPSAARVAEVAGVGLRSVFRHFQDMDALYREMGELIEARVLPIVLKTLDGEDWREKMNNLAERRAEVFEAILPYRISANLRRFESAYLMQDYRRMLRLESELVEAHLPPHVKADRDGANALNVILSFQTWRLLRHDQGLPVTQASAVVNRLLQDVMAGLPRI